MIKKPNFTLFGAGPETIGVAASWKGSAAVYRVRISYRSPEGFLKQSRVSVTFDPPERASFRIAIALPKAFANALTSSDRAIVTLELLSTQDEAVFKDLSSAKVSAIYLSGGATELNLVPFDRPEVATLDYRELLERRKKLVALEKKAIAKAAAKVAAPVIKAPVASEISTIN